MIRDITPDTGLWPICEQNYFVLKRAIRSDLTKNQYRIAVRHFGEYLGLADESGPTVSHLTDDHMCGYTQWLQDRTANRVIGDKKMAPKTVNERVGRIVSLWRWLADRGHVQLRPTWQRIPEPRRIPTAWTVAELQRILQSAQAEQTLIGHVPAAAWWESLLLVLWDSGERITAVMAARWEWLQGDYFHVPAEARKGCGSDMLYRLHRDTAEILERRREAPANPLWPWPFSYGYLWLRFGIILKRAGLPCGRRDKFHRIRRSVATHVQASGLNASLLLGHASDAITRRSYLDPRLLGAAGPCDVLPRLTGNGNGNGKPD